jgi:hypothetical protein
MLAAYNERFDSGTRESVLECPPASEKQSSSDEREVTRMWKTWDLWMTFAKNIQGWVRACVYTLDRHTSPMANDVVAVFKSRALSGPQQ